MQINIRYAIAALLLLLLGASEAFAASPPHTDYRPAYAAGCGGGAACHTVVRGSFLPSALDDQAATDYTNFCVSCHNISGEAHDKPAGSPSTNIYDHLTGFTPGGYKGNSHSWNGQIGGAGTRPPALGGFGGTAHMPSGKVRCQTCHAAMNKDPGIENIGNGNPSTWVQAYDTGDHKNYSVSGYAGTAQYLAQYLRVYRSKAAIATPSSTRGRKQHLVSPGEYAYSPQDATITFKAFQNSTSVYYVDIWQPYLREDNTGNRICTDCHNDRQSDRVRHTWSDPPSGKANHPAGVPYGYAFGSRTTLKNLSSMPLYLEGGKVLCTSCHDVHNARGNEGSILREDTGSALCLDCHDEGKVGQHKGARHPRYANTSTIPTVCVDCHSPHGSGGNIYLVKERVKTPNSGMRGVRFGNLTGPGSFGEDTGSSICEVCHTSTQFHKSDGMGKGHNTRKNCTTCHRHSAGFSPAGGSSPCYGCHDGSIGPDIKALMGLGTTLAYGGKTSRHIIAFDNQSSSSCLVMCHTSAHNSGSPNVKTEPELALCNNALCHNGGFEVTSQGRSISVGGDFAPSLHNYTTAVQDEFGLFSYNANCTKCHVPHGSESYPNLRKTVNGRAANGNSEDLCFGCHDGGRSKGAADIKDLWKANPANKGHYDYSKSRQMSCMACHGVHGTKNSKMVQDSLGGPGLSKDAICRACHSGNGGSVYNVMGNTPGSYGQNFGAASVHDFGLNVAIGGHTVDLTCTGCHDPHNTQNARLLQDRVVFSGVSSVAVGLVGATVQPQGPVTAYTAGWSAYCTICHTSMALTGGQSPYRRHPVEKEPGPFFRNTSFYGMRPVPLESGKIACVSCHYTHGSPRHSLLRFANATTPENRLCLQCHEKDSFMQGGAGSHGGFMQNQGRCADCHNMHSKANRKLLQEGTESVLCFSCHGGSGISKYNVWKDGTTITPAGLKGTGGSFGRYSELRGGTMHSMHDINDEATPAPGGVTTQHRCGTCHNPHGSKNYRVLRTEVNNVTGIYVSARTDAQGNFINYSAGFLRFCTACHSSYGTTSDVNGNWIRHPVGVPISNYSSPRYFYANSTSYKPKVELESGDRITCVSCHYAHGSPVDSNLKYPGGKSVNTCKTCHNRDTFSAGTPGSHAGFTGNQGTCSDCHSMHKEGNAKLLNASAETGICVNCHDNPGTSTSPNKSHLDVWKGNVFGSPSSWLGTAGSFGTYDPVNGGDAPSMHPVNSDARIAPGDSATVVHCGTCHDTHGSANYRLLKTKLNGKGGISVTATVDARGRTVAYGGGMSGFCTACHKAYINCGSAAGYTRHPVDVALTSQEMANYNHAHGYDYLPLESGNKVTCITCHFAHGSPNEKMKRMPGNQMCQVCHAKGLDPANGYNQVMHTHGGFSGNGGNCGVCHSMHTANNRKLLVDAEETALCYSCHGPGGSRRASFPQAQLVWRGTSPGAPGEWDGAAGSFGAFYNATTGGDIASHHNINKTDSPAPGGTTTEHRCGTCHNPHGNNNYRLLRDDVNGSTGISVRADVMGNYSSGISSFCAACHVQYGETGSGVEGYRRHPVNVALTADEKANLSGASGVFKAQVEGKNVMCLSCHFAHGSPSYSMLRMVSYTSSESAICQQCHKKGYNAQGQQVRYTHGGFSGNKANCKVCHSIHAKDNKKLLMEPKESQLCANCHSGIDKFNSFRAHDPEVNISAPSRFNVFSSIGNSFGNYSAGGGDVVSWHEVDGTHIAPGGKTLELRCGKCHNPHGGDNFVMLRDSVEGVDNIKVFGRLSSTGPFNTYSSGFASFCSACHTRLVNCGTGNPWTRHPVDFRLKDKQFRNWSTTDITPRVPLEAGSQVTCITCHNSHGSKNYRLQRLGGNDMCQQCHRR